MPELLALLGTPYLLELLAVLGTLALLAHLALLGKNYVLLKSIKKL
jgi:hypothetical protein